MTTKINEMKKTNLFKPVTVGSVTLKNRLVYAPTTRFRNSNEFIATDSMLEYYGRRSENNGGLLITEACVISPNYGVDNNIPMIYNNEQVESWKQIVSTVHENGSYISCQLWTMGRQCDPRLLKKRNLPFIGPSKIYGDKLSEKMAEDCGYELQEMSYRSIKGMIEEYSEAAKKCIFGAGFDFVEIHAAYMYLLDQFLHPQSNHRNDEYGGNIQNRSRIVLEVVDAIIDAVGIDKVGIRFSPYSMSHETDPATYSYIFGELERRSKNGKKLAYLSIIEPCISDGCNITQYSTLWIEKIWSGIIITTGGYLQNNDHKRVVKTVDRDNRTLIGICRYYTSNCDLVDRLKHGYELTLYDENTFYNAMSNLGYLTYTKYDDADDHSKDNVSPKPLVSKY